ncbi:hypothetical protein ACWKWU_09610 [Chitinophaga lutea]
MRTSWKIILSIIAGLLLLAAGALWYLNVHWKGILDKELRHYVAQSSDSLYTLDYGHIRLNLLTGSLGISNVRLRPDSQVYERLVREQRAPSVVYDVKAAQLSVSHMRLWQYFIRKKVDAGAFVLLEPEITVTEDRRSRDTSRQRSFYEAVQESIHSFNIGRMSLTGTTVAYTQIGEDSSRQMTRVKNLDVEVRGLEIDSISQRDPTRFLYARNFDINLDKWELRTADSLYWLRVNKISYHAIERAVDIGEVRLDPRYSIAEFDKRIDYQQDRFELVFRNIRVDGLPRMSLLRKSVVADKVKINGGLLNVYRNRGLPLPPGDKLGQFPNQLLARLELPLRIDTLAADGVDVSYTERNPANGETGKVQFLHAGGLIRNITNIDSLVKANRQCIADLHAVFMRSGKLKARFDFRLGDKAGAFAVSGQLADMDGRDVNPVTKPLGMIEIRSARIDQLDFNLKGNERSCAGTLQFRYSNLRIAMLKRDEDGSGTVRQGVVSLIANIMAIHNANPSQGEALRKVKPHFTRDPKKSFFNLVWKTIFVGVKQTVGTEFLADMEKKKKL